MFRQLDCHSLKKWFNTHKRDLPWRQTRDPYAIWISEIMLQQTQVVVVIPYYLKWMNLFPTVEALAFATLEAVIKAWEGLGYYSRARNLHQAAQTIVAKFDGKIPKNEEQLKTIKGLGPYTVGALLSFAFHQKAAAVDGNVLRVLTRYFGLEDDISKSATHVKMRQIAFEILPDEEPWIINEALIELGATICQKKAQCHRCPLSESCNSFINQLTHLLPIKTKKLKVEKIYRAVAVIQCDECILVKKGEKGQVMSDLYEFVSIDLINEVNEKTAIISSFQKMFHQTLHFHHFLSKIKHGFTRYSVTLFPYLFSVKHLENINGYEWIEKKKLAMLPFSSGHKRLLCQLII